MNNTTKQQQQLAKAPKHLKARILELLADCKAMLDLKLIGEAKAVLKHARSLMDMAASSIPQAIKYSRHVYMASRNSNNTITVLTMQGVCLIVGTGKAYQNAIKQGAAA